MLAAERLKEDKKVFERDMRRCKKVNWVDYLMMVSTSQGPAKGRALTSCTADEHAVACYQGMYLNRHGRIGGSQAILAFAMVLDAPI